MTNCTMLMFNRGMLLKYHHQTSQEGSYTWQILINITFKSTVIALPQTADLSLVKNVIV